MTTTPARILKLEDLSNGIPVIPDEAVGFYKQNCIICFDSQGHQTGLRMEVFHKGTFGIAEVCWDGSVTEQILRAYRDERKTTDFGACAIALLLIRELTEFTSIEQSNVGTTIDYYLVRKGQNQQNDTLIFNEYAAYLEVSGIRQENAENTVEDRVKNKVRWLKRADDLPVFITVVEFSRPYSKTVEV